MGRSRPTWTLLAPSEIEMTHLQRAAQGVDVLGRGTCHPEQPSTSWTQRSSRPWRARKRPAELAPKAPSPVQSQLSSTTGLIARNAPDVDVCWSRGPCMVMHFSSCAGCLPRLGMSALIGDSGVGAPIRHGSDASARRSPIERGMRHLRAGTQGPASSRQIGIRVVDQELAGGIVPDKSLVE